MILPLLCWVLGVAHPFSNSYCLQCIKQSNFDILIGKRESLSTREAR